MDWKIQHNKDVNSTQIDILINTISIKYSGKFLIDIEVILKCKYEGKESGIAKITLRKNNKMERISLLIYQDLFYPI